jgi:DNA-binding response OmpR family regulator
MKLAEVTRADPFRAPAGDVLCIDDDEVTQILLEEVVRLAGAVYHHARTAEEAKALLAGRGFDLVVLDRRLPDSDGLLLLELVQRRCDCPVIVLSQMGGPQDRQLGLGLGAMEYLTKPFNPAELSTRIRGLLEREWRRRDRDHLKPFVHGLLAYHPGERRLRVGENETYLPPAEARLLSLLLSHQGEVLSRDDLTLGACGRDWSPGDRTADVLVARLRQKLPNDLLKIVTVHRMGYALHLLSKD